MIERLCLFTNCDISFTVASTQDPKKFCSLSCSARHNNSKRGPRTKESKICVSNTMKGRPNPRKGQGANGLRDRNCSFCKTTFKARGSKKFCSDSCYRQSHSERMSEWLKANRIHIKGRSSPSYMEQSFATWLKEHDIQEGLKGFLTEVKFNIKGSKKRGWADFVFPKLKLIIELDGSHHKNRKELDEIRDATLLARGWKVVRITHTEYRKKTRIDEIRTLLGLEVPGGIEPRTVLPTFNGSA